MFMILKIVRQLLGNLIVFLNVAVPPRKVKRTQTEQTQVDQQTPKLALYQFRLCPFCVRVRRMMTRLNLKIETIDAKSKEHETDLIAGGGKRKVPCLRIEKDNKVTWLYDSLAINNYLTKHFGHPAA